MWVFSTSRRPFSYFCSVLLSDGDKKKKKKRNMFQCLRFLLGMCCFKTPFAVLHCDLLGNIPSSWVQMGARLLERQPGDEVWMYHFLCFNRLFTKLWVKKKTKCQTRFLDNNASENIWVLPWQCFPLTDVFCSNTSLVSSGTKSHFIVKHSVGETASKMSCYFDS